MSDLYLVVDVPKKPLRDLDKLKHIGY